MSAVSMEQISEKQTAPRGFLTLQGKKILVIEDVPDTRLLARYYIRGLGGEADFAENGLEGYRKAVRPDYDVVVMDLQMPVMDGYEAVQILRKWGVTIPIIAWTAHPSKEDREHCLRLGFSDYMAKPIDQKGFLRVLGPHLVEPEH